MQATGPPDTSGGTEDWKNKRARRLSEIKAFSGEAMVEREPSSSSEDVPICWICLDAARTGTTLMQPCKCPRFAHAHCLARWQLQSAGSRRETHCEFCDARLPDWKRTLTPISGANAPAVMNVNFDGRTYSFEVKPGADGYRQFTEAIRRAFSLPEDSELNITFTCDEPSADWGQFGEAGSRTMRVEPPPPPPPPPVVQHVSPTAGATTAAGSLLTLQGAGAYDAAVHCASVSAARRLLQQRSSDHMLPHGQHHSYSRHMDAHGIAPPFITSASGSAGPSGLQGDARNNALAKTRRLSGIGRKLRSALCDFLNGNK